MENWWIGSDIPFPWTSKWRDDLARGRFPRGLPAQGKGRVPGGILRFQTSPKGRAPGYKRKGTKLGGRKSLVVQSPSPWALMWVRLMMLKAWTCHVLLLLLQRWSPWLQPATAVGIGPLVDPVSSGTIGRPTHLRMMPLRIGCTVPFRMVLWTLPSLLTGVGSSALPELVLCAACVIECERCPLVPLGCLVGVT